MKARHDHLLAAIRHQGGQWTTERAHQLYRDSNIAPGRSTARGDLQHLARAGHLTQHGKGNACTYTLRTAR